MISYLDKRLIKGSFILLIAINLYNALNFLFHLFMARFLTIEEYGVLAALFSIMYITGFFSESIQIVITKYSSSKISDGKLKNILKKSIKKAIPVGFLLFILYSITSMFLYNRLNIPYVLMFVTGFIIILSFVLPINRAILQGRKKFMAFGWNMIAEGLIKLSLSLLFVFFGWSVYGAIIGTILGISFAYLISFFSLSDIIKSKEERSDTSGIYYYSRPAFIVILSVLVFYSIDAFIAKIVFNSETAGHYAIASTLSKIIFWGTQPISKAMFPLSADKEEKKHRPIFISSFLLLSLALIMVLLLFYFMPNLIIKIFSGRNIVQSAEILFYLGIGTSLLSISNLLLLYKLSRGNIRYYWVFPLFIILEVFLLFLFSGNIVSYSISFAFSSAIFLFGALTLTFFPAISNILKYRRV